MGEVITDTEQGNIMKAIVVVKSGGPEELLLRDVPTPSPGPGEVTIDVAFAGVGLVDTLLRRGILGVPLPFVPGLEAAGLVRQVGEGVHGFRPGEPVAAWLDRFGGYGEVALARADLTVPLRSPDEAARAATVFVNGTTAWMSVHDVAHVGPADTVLVLGATGGVGALVGQFSLHAGASRVIGTVGSDAKRNAALNLGYHEVILTDHLADWLSQNNDSPPSAVFDPVGGAARRIVFQHLPPFGRQVILGDAAASDTSFPGDEFWRGTKNVLGLNVGGIARQMPDRVTRAAKNVLDLAADRKIIADPGLTLSLGEARKAHELLETRSIAGEIVLDMRSMKAPRDAQSS